MWQTLKDILREFREASPLAVLVGFLLLIFMASFAILGFHFVLMIIRIMVSVAQG